MPHLTSQIQGNGALIQLVVGVSGFKSELLRKAGKAVPTPVVANLLIDTGASCTMLDHAVIEKLQLVPTGQIPISTPSTGQTTHACNQYDIALMLHHVDNSRVFTTIPVLSSDFASQNIDGLLGRDVLTKCLLVYNGANRMFALAF